MTENKNLNHTFSSDVNMPFCLIRLITVSLIEGFFFFFFFFFLGGGGGGGGGERGGVGCGHMFAIP